MDSYCICYNIVDHNFSGLPALPEAYIVSKKGAQFEYIEKQATPEIISEFNIQYPGTPHEQLIEICTLLRPTALEQRFKPKKSRKNLNLSQLLLEDKTKELIDSFVNRKLGTFYQLITQNQYPIAYQAKRKEPLDSSIIEIAKLPLDPILRFTKTEEGIEYAFSLKDEASLFAPKDKSIKILLNDPSWIIVNKKLFRIKNLNANKLKPFLQKDKITIAQKHVKTYLEKVIVPVSKNIEVQAEGFEIVNKQDVLGYTLEIIQDFIQDLYVAKITFEYEHCTFDFHQSKKTASEIIYNEDQITIVQTKRNLDIESEVVEKITSKGLLQNQNLLFEVSESNDPYGIITWVTNHKTALQKEGFAIQLPNVLGQQVSTTLHQLTIRQEQQKDWFDIKGWVTIGDQEIPFSKFIKYIRNNDRCFPLNNNETFIIPLEWMTRYKKLADFGTFTDDKITLAKSNYTVLKEVIPEEELPLYDQNESSAPYHPSSNLKARLRPYQLEGVQWLVNHYNNGLGACLADDMGLGKTLQTIATLVHAKEQLQPSENEVNKIQFDLFATPLETRTFLKTLIVLPSSLVFNWAQEIIKFAPHLNLIKYTGADRKKNAPYLESYDVVLTTYGIISRDHDMFQKLNFNYLILDESQQIKNKDSKIFQAINTINTIHKISLSGTPIENSLSDLWSQMQFINPGMLGSFAFFKEHFKTPIEQHQNEEKIAELKSLIEPFILRRTKNQVAKDLPELTEQIRYSEMQPEQKRSYESEKSAARNLLLGLDHTAKNKIHIINTLTKLRQLANHPQLVSSETQHTSGKFDDVTHHLQTLVAAQKKVLVFSSFVSHLAIYEKWSAAQGISFLSLTGKTAAKERETIVNRFQEEDDISLFFISLKAGGVGLNLTKASYVVLLDPWWNPFAEKQAIARAHRIGQTNKVLVTRFISKNTIEEKIIQLQEQKQSLSDELIAIDGIPEYIESNLEVLLK